MLLGCALYFTIRTHFVQFRMLGEMIRLLGDGVPKSRKRGEAKHISSFQAFMVSLASRIGTGNQLIQTALSPKMGIIDSIFIDDITILLSK